MMDFLGDIMGGEVCGRHGNLHGRVKFQQALAEQVFSYFFLTGLGHYEFCVCIGEIDSI
jgi:hypothetical protein